MTVIVVGLGPGPAGWVSLAAREALGQPGTRVVARTAFHPALAEILPEGRYTSLDTLYEEARTLDDLVNAIVEHLATPTTFEDVVYAVPGDGWLGEATVARLVERGARPKVIPGVSLGTSALAAAGLPTLEGAQVVEAPHLGLSGGAGVEVNPRWPAVLTSVYSTSLASDVKLALQRVYPESMAIQVVHHPGMPDERVESLPLADLDRGRVPLDHLTHVVLGSVATEAPTGSSHGLRAIVGRLRAPEVGCPWDLSQTHQSLVPYVLEEAYEVADAIEHGSSADLMEELGDLLLQVALHAELADQEGDFDWNDVVRTLSAKLVYRHPHVFGDVKVEGASDVVRNWDQLKAAERADQPAPASVLDGVPRSLPALKQAAELVRKAVKAGFDWPERGGTLAKVQEELGELLAAPTLAERQEELGDLLFILAKLASEDGVDPEAALRAANRKFVRRFQTVERLASERGWTSLKDRPSSDLLDLWEEAKRNAPVLPAGAAEG